ncbi:MAG: dockerin type I repeat-containing protein [Prevotella sp.]|nr:dockerin type I repeat-containing protein [Prevotella sp.]
MNKFIQFLTMLCMMTAAQTMQAADYTTLLTPARGFTEVTSTNAIVASPDYYYILVSAENTGLVVGIGAYEAKPDWASTESKALRYLAADETAVLESANFFTIEQDGNYIGLRNVVYSADLFQTHENAGYMYVNTYTDKALDEWSWLIPTFQDGYWLFENGKYPMSSEAQWKGYMGSWTPGRLEIGEPIALNRLNTSEDPAGHYRLFRIAKSDLRTTQKKLLKSASTTNPLNATWLITNPSFETGDMTGWTFVAYNSDGEVISPEDYNDTGLKDYNLTYKDGLYLFNAYQWWCPSMSITQTVNDMPCGEYELSALLCTWEGRNVFFSANGSTVTKTGVNDIIGIPVTIPIMVGADGKLMITAGSNSEWWNAGHEGETQTFFKLDDLRLVCKKLYQSEEEASFTAAALNVDGLPQKILGFITVNEDGPGSDGTKLISRYLKMKGYDFIGVSEDFNYHGSLMSEIDDYYDSGEVRATLSLGDFSYPFDTDGLNLIWKTSKVSAENETWTRWEHSESGDGNQYVKKGYRHYDMTVGEGLVIDVYVLHMDAGDVVSSREQQWSQMADAINSSDSSRPKLVIGDTNSRWTREDIRTNFIDKLNGYSVGDPWVQFYRGGIYPTTDMSDLTDQTDQANFTNYEVVDKILYVNPSAADALQLVPKKFRIEQDYTYGYVNVTSDTKWLGDHRPVVVDFSLVRLSELKFLAGDVNRDGKVDIADLTALVNYLITHEGDYDLEAADMNHDGDVTTDDVEPLVNLLLAE